MPLCDQSVKLSGSKAKKTPPISGDSWIEESSGNLGEASSSVPNPVPVDQEISQDILWNELNQSLLEDEIRREQLSRKLALAMLLKSDFPTHTDLESLRFKQEVQTHMVVEIELEKDLRMEGYLPSAINRTRAQVRDLLLYSGNGVPYKKSILDGYLSEMSTDFRKSKPFNKLIKARDNHELCLYKPGDFFYKLYYNDD